MNNKIIDCRDLFNESTKGFIGREEVVRAVDEFLEVDDCQYLLLLGEPGRGKTAFIANLVGSLNSMKKGIRNCGSH